MTTSEVRTKTLFKSCLNRLDEGPEYVTIDEVEKIVDELKEKKENKKINKVPIDMKVKKMLTEKLRLTVRHRLPLGDSNYTNSSQVDTKVVNLKDLFNETYFENDQDVNFVDIILDENNNSTAVDRRKAVKKLPKVKRKGIRRTSIDIYEPKLVNATTNITENS